MVNDRHPSGITTSTVPAPDASYPYDEAYGQQGTAHGYAGYDGYSTGNFNGLAAAYSDSDPLFGALPGSPDGGGYGTVHHGSTSGQYNAAQWGGAGGAYDSGSYDTTAMWAGSGVPLSGTIPAQQGSDTGGQWDATAWDTTGHHDLTAAQATQAVQGAHWDGTGQFDASGVDTGQTQFWDMSTYATVDESQYGQNEYEQNEYEQSEFGQNEYGQGEYQEDGYEHGGYQQQPAEQPYAVPEAEPEPGAAAVHEAETQTALMVLDLDPPRAGTADSADTTAASDPAGPAGSAEPADAADLEGDSTAEYEAVQLPSPRRDSCRSRRRSSSARPKRSALLTVAVPSVAALGITAVAAASVSNIGDDKKDAKTTQAASDTPPVKASVANSKLDTQLAAGLQDADDFRARASRTQERIDLQARQAAEKKRKIQEAARKEALRPKFALPVAQHGLSATYGQAGINWMSMHTGIDFPVSYGTPVMAATDGTVRTQWNDAYGNMVIVTSPDGTETWYCHLSTAKIRAGSVKAGDVIAYSGNSGNSTGPHLHFEVHPGGGTAIDPLSWLRSHGLDPT